MFDRNNYKLQIKEKQQQTALRFLLFIIVVSIIKGIYNSSRNIDQDSLLMPLLLFASSFFCLIYGINAITKGNLVKRWMNEMVFSALISLISKNSKREEHVNISNAAKFIGIIMLTLSACLFVSAVYYIVDSHHVTTSVK